MKALQLILRGLLVFVLVLGVVGCEGDSSSSSSSGSGTVDPVDPDPVDPVDPVDPTKDENGNTIGAYLALGDGITYGTHLDGAPAWPERLERMFGDERIVYNGGEPGGHVCDEGVGQLHYRLTKYTPQYVMIFYGINDVANGYSIFHIEAALESMIQDVKATGAVPILATLTPVYNDDEHEVLYSALNSKIRRLCERYYIPCADLAREFGSDRSLISEDGYHPTVEGQEYIALVFYDILD